MAVLETILDRFWPVILLIVFWAVMVGRSFRAKPAISEPESEDDALTEDEDERLDRLEAAFVIDAGHPRRNLLRRIGTVTVAAAALTALYPTWQPLVVAQNGKTTLEFYPVEEPWEATGVILLIAAVVLFIIYSYGVLKITVTGRDIDVETTRRKGGQVSVDHLYYDVTDVQSFREVDTSGSRALLVTFVDGKCITVRDPLHYEPFLDYLKRADRWRRVPASRNEPNME